MPGNTVKTTITVETLQRSRQPSICDEETIGNLLREATERPTAPVKELQEFLYGSKPVTSAFEFEFTMNYETDFEFMKLNIRFLKIQ